MTLARRKTRTKAQLAYHDAAANLGCVVCRWRIAHGMQDHQPNYTRLHHRNLDDKHGQKQLGQDFVVAMCDWHHQGIPAVFEGFGTEARTPDEMREAYGPSFELHARDFREWTYDVLPGYGRGTEAWQKYQDELLEGA
jgi:hypothetical protein